MYYTIPPSHADNQVIMILHNVGFIGQAASNSIHLQIKNISTNSWLSYCNKYCLFPQYDFLIIFLPQLYGQLFHLSLLSSY